MIWPELSDPVAAQACMSPGTVFAPNPIYWRRYLLHALWPLEPGFIRAFLTSTVLLVQGYALEYEIGTSQFAGLFLGIHAASAVVSLYFRFVDCFNSLESTLAGLAVVMHHVNPKLHTDGLDKSIRVPFQVEPRWHVWIIFGGLLLLAGDFPTALVTFGVGLTIGGICVLRDPEMWSMGFNAIKRRTFTAGAVLHMALLLFTLLFFPLTALSLPSDPASAVLAGHVFSLAWWKTQVQSSPAVLHMCMGGLILPQALFICKLLLSSALPLVLSPYQIWAKFYAGACVLLAMYAMNGKLWLYPHCGFLALIYLVWAFWRLPGSPKLHYS